jgi:hypothetical protein
VAPSKRYAVGDEKLNECALVVCGHEARHAALEGVEIHPELMKERRDGVGLRRRRPATQRARSPLRGLEEEAAWIERYRQLWNARFDDLDEVVGELKRKEKVDGRKKRD